MSWLMPGRRSQGAVAAAVNDFTFVVTPVAGFSTRMALKNTGTYNFTIDWGDGNSDVITSWDQAEVYHTWAGTGPYTCSINGDATFGRWDTTSATSPSFNKPPGSL